jgi:hypothetical protein
MFTEDVLSPSRPHLRPVTYSRHVWMVSRYDTPVTIGPHLKHLCVTCLLPTQDKVLTSVCILAHVNARFTRCTSSHARPIWLCSTRRHAPRALSGTIHTPLGSTAPQIQLLTPPGSCRHAWSSPLHFATPVYSPLLASCRMHWCSYPIRSSWQQLPHAPESDWSMAHQVGGCPALLPSAISWSHPGPPADTNMLLWHCMWLQSNAGVAFQ